MKVLKSLKRGKSKDSHNMINELFILPVAGPDLVKSFTKMMNIIKQDRNLHQQFRYKNSILLSSLLFSSEVWYNFLTKNIFPTEPSI